MTARILVVDDNKNNIKLLSAKLAKDYYEILTAENGVEAIEVAHREVPDLILLDVMMPEMDGFEACTKLKASRTTQHIPIVMVTALTEIEDRIKGLECGADDFLAKPINDMALTSRVKSLLRLKMTMDEWRLREATAAHFSLPLVEEETVETNKGKILLLESDAHDRHTIITHLSALGSDVTAIGSLEEALEQTRTDSSWDLVMISFSLGHDVGLHLCAQLRAHEATRTLPILLIAGPHQIEYVARGLDIGANDYLLLPVEGAELKARTRTQLKQKYHYDRLRRNYENSLALALIDPLTGAYNRRYMDMHLPMLFARCKMTERPLSVVFLDLDHFKKVNDTYGHAAGDFVLKETIARVMMGLRPSDLVVRMGGEEFAILMPETPHTMATGVGERLRESLANTPFLLPDSTTSLTVTGSFGVASLNHESDKTPAALLERADAAVYNAKQTGRNKVVGENS